MPVRHPPITIPAEETDLAYLAGIVDGEGSICIMKAFDKKSSKNPGYGIKVSIVNCEKALMSWLETKVGGVVYWRQNENSNHRPAFTWVVHGENAERILDAIFPYLVLKRPQAHLALRVRSLRRHKKDTSLDVFLRTNEELKSCISLFNRRGA